MSLLSKHEKLLFLAVINITKRPANTPEEEVYARFCNEAKQEAGIGTQDAMRKNLFVDLHRMGLINRFDKNENKTNPFSSQSVRYVSLSQLGLRFIDSKTILDKYFIFSKGIDQLLGGFINILLNILRDPDNDIDKIDITEFMFFVSAIGTSASFNLNQEECVEYIKNYRNLTGIQRKAVTETLKDKLKPEKFIGPKTLKRDYHNWTNKAEQIYSILDQTVYFEVRGTILVLKTGQNSYVEGEEPKRLDRSLNEKYQYFQKHEVEKTKGFELHHVVPLSWAENIHQFKLFDKWQNMVYIDAFSHAKITQNRNRNVLMKIDGDNFILSDYSNNEVFLENMKNILYMLEKQNLLLEYNQTLLETKTP